MLATPLQRGRVEAALLDFQRHPGRHAVALRQPSDLFGALREILQIAAGRPAWREGGPPRAELVDAACFFVRTALLQPGASHYVLLGLAPNAPAPLVKERYRQLMRLLHPDHAPRNSADTWAPGDAARINQAYEVLADAERRKAYDRSLSGPVSAPVQVPVPVTATSLLRARSRVRLGTQPPRMDLRRTLPRLAAAFGAAGSVAMLGAWLARGEPDRETLVQRDAPPRFALAGAQPAMPKPRPELEPVAEPGALAPGAGGSPAALLPTSRRGASSPPILGRQGTVPPETWPLRPGRVAADLHHGLAAPVSANDASESAENDALHSSPQNSSPITAWPQANAGTPEAALPGPEGLSQTPAAAPAAARAKKVLASTSTSPAAPTVAEVHSQLTRLVQNVESGRAERVLGMLGREARASAGAQALLLHYNAVLGGARPARVSQVRFKSQALEDRLVVHGLVVMEFRDAPPPERSLRIQAEFVMRDGAPVLTRLTHAPQ